MARRLALLGQPVTGWPGVSILCLDEVENLICRLYLSVAACKLGRTVSESNQQTTATLSGSLSGRVCV